MKLYNFNFYDKSFNIVHYAQAEAEVLDFDYLTPESVQITIATTKKVEAGHFVSVSGIDGYLGIVDTVDVDKYVAKISIKPFTMLFDQPVLVNTDWQGNDNTALENVLGTLIYDNWINTDSAKKLPLNLIFELSSKTTNWTFNLKPDNEESHYCICEFYDVMLQEALLRYRVTVKPTFNLRQKRIDISIGAPAFEATVEADLESTVINEFTIGKLDMDVNKLTVYEEPDYRKKIVYFLHTDGTFSTTDKLRVTPVKEEIVSVKPQEGTETTEEKTLEDLAEEQAKNKFEDVKWNNCIELVIANGPDLKFGQICNVRHDGKIYRSILTGMKYGAANTYTFGALRIDYTKTRQLAIASQFIGAKNSGHVTDSSTPSK